MVGSSFGIQAQVRFIVSPLIEGIFTTDRAFQFSVVNAQTQGVAQGYINIDITKLGGEPARVGAGVLGAIELYKLGQTAYYAAKGMIEFNKDLKQRNKVDQVFNDLQFALTNKLVNKEFINPESLGLIGNFLLQGETKGMSPELMENA